MATKKRKSDFLTNSLGMLLCMLIAACKPSGPIIHQVGILNVDTAYAVFVQGDSAFVANNDGVVVIDIRDRGHPKKVALIESNELATDVLAQDELVYIASPPGLVIANINDLTSPSIVGTYSASEVINRICLFDQIVYASTLGGDLRIINVEDPSNPYLIGSYAPEAGMGLLVVCLEDIVYYSTAEKGLILLDVSDPASPVNLLTIPGTTGAKDAQIFGEFLYLSCHSFGVRILDIGDPWYPKIIASFNNGGEAWGIGGGMNDLWVGDLQQGVEFYNLNNIHSPHMLAQDGQYAPHDIFYDGQFAYLADQDRGFIILDYIGGGEQ